MSHHGILSCQIILINIYAIVLSHFPTFARWGAEVPAYSCLFQMLGYVILRWTWKMKRSANIIYIYLEFTHCFGHFKLEIARILLGCCQIRPWVDPATLRSWAFAGVLSLRSSGQPCLDCLGPSWPCYAIFMSRYAPKLGVNHFLRDDAQNPLMNHYPSIGSSGLLL